MKKLPTKTLFKNALLSILKPHRAFKEISKNKLNYKILIPLIIIWGGVFIFLNFLIAQKIFIWLVPYALLHIFNVAIYSLVLFIGGIIFFYLLSKIFKKKVPIEKIEIAVFYLWFLWAIMPFFDFPHALGLKMFVIPGLNIGAHFSWFVVAPILLISLFFLIKDVLNFNSKKEKSLAVLISFSIPLFIRIFVEQAPIFFNYIFGRLKGNYFDATIFSFFITPTFALLFIGWFFYFKKIDLKKVFYLALILILFFLNVGPDVFTNPLIQNFGKIPDSYLEPEKGDPWGRGLSRYTHSYTWSNDFENSTVTQSSLADQANYTDREMKNYSTFNLDFVPENVTITAIRCKVDFTGCTNWSSDTKPYAHCGIAGGDTPTTWHDSTNWTDLSGDPAEYTYTWTSPAWASELATTGNDIRVRATTAWNGDANAPAGDVVSYNNLVLEIDYTGGDFTQHTYRWYANADAVQPTDPWPSGATDLAENTAITSSDSPPASGDVLRLRMNVKGAMTYNTQAFKLQYGQGSTCSSVSTWTDVDGLSGSGIWRGYNNGSVSDGIITSTLLSTSNKKGSYEESNPSINNPDNPGPTMAQYSEYDWVIQHNGAAENTDYCFRMVESGGTVLDTYTNYPKLTTESAAINQRAYIFEDDNGANVNSNNDIAAANTALTDVLRGQRFVARLQIDETNDVDVGDKTYKLQYDKNSNGQWTDVRMAGAPSSNSGGAFNDWEINTVYDGSTNGTGNYSSIAVGTDGYPVVAFHDPGSNSGDLRVCKCEDTDCIKTPTCSIVDSGTVASDNVGQSPSIAIGTDGYPIISHYDSTNGDLRVCHCGSDDCSSSVNCYIPASTGTIGDKSSIAINSDGDPVIAYGGGGVNFCKCTDAGHTCSTSSCRQVESGVFGGWNSIAVPSDNKPVISTFSQAVGSAGLRFYKCSDSSCTGTEVGTPTNIDTTCPSGGIAGLGNSIVIGTDGYPIISHYCDKDGTGWGGDLKLCDCADTTCSSKTCNVVIPHVSYNGPRTRLAIDKDGFPIIVAGTYYSYLFRYVKCNDISCASINNSDIDEFYITPDSTSYGSNGDHRNPSVAIGSDGYPVVAYNEVSTEDLKVAKMLPLAEIQASWGLSGSNGDNLTAAAAGTCYESRDFQEGEWHEATGTTVSYNLNQNDCTEFGFMIDTSEVTVGVQYRLRLIESNGTALDLYSQYPTFTITSEVNNNKRYSKQSVVRSASTCGSGSSSYNCTDIDSATVSQTFWGGSSIAIGTDGYPVISYIDYASSGFRVLKCNDPACTGGDETITTIGAGMHPSIAIGTDGYPVIAYLGTGPTLNVLKCNDPACTGGDETITTVDDPANNVGYLPSLAIGNDGYPVISYNDATAGALKYVHCTNASCSSFDSPVTVDDYSSAGNMFYPTSIAIGTDGQPVISYFHNDNSDPYLARYVGSGGSGCDIGATWNCSAIDSSGTRGLFNSIAISEDDGYPIIAYPDTDHVLYFADCNDASCSGGDETVTSIDDPGTATNSSYFLSLAVGKDGNPVISYYDDDNDRLKIAEYVGGTSGSGCSISSAWNCTSIDDPASNDVGYWTSVAIGTSGYPSVSYFDYTAGDLKFTTGLGLPTTASAYFNKSVAGDNQFKYSADNTNSQFLQHFSLVEDGLLYWLDDRGYDYVDVYDANRDQITSAANESPVYEFIDKHSSASNNIYVQWIGQSDVAAGTKNIKLEIYNFNTNSWELVTTESSCAANTDCSIEGSKTSNLSYYYFPRYNYDSTKAKRDTTAEYYTYWRVYQETAAGSQTLKTDDWTLASVPVITVSGNAYNDETSTALTECDGSTPMISLRVGSTTYGPVSCADADGAFSFDGVVSGSAGDPMVFWIDGQTPKASTVNRYSGSGNVTGMEVRKDRLMIMSDSGNVTNANLGIWDNANDTDVIYDVDGSNNLTLEDGYKLIVNSGDTFEPGATITTSPSASQATTDGDILIEGTATMTVGTNAISCGGDWTATGTFTKSSGQITTFTATANNHQIVSGSSHLDNITFNGSGGVWSPSTNTMYIDGDLAMTTGTFDTSNGTANVEVAGNVQGTSGVINMTSTNTFTQKVASAKGFGTTSGSTNWAFYNLTFDTSSGSPTITANSGGTGTIEIKNVMTIAASTTLDASNRTWNLSGSGTPFVATGTFTPSTSTIKYTGTSATNITATTYNNLELSPSGAGSPTFTLASGTINTNGYLTVGDGTYAVTVNVDTNDPTLNVDGNFATSTNATFTASQTGTFTVGSSWSNSGTFNHSSGTVTFDAGATGKTITTGGSSFYNLTFDNASGGWTFAAGNHDVDYNFTITNGTVTASSGILYVGRNFANSGTFNHGSGTVTLDTTNTATILGSTTFYNLTSITASKVIVFTASTTQTIATGGSLTLNGQDCGTMITLSSSSSPTQWNINVQSSVTVSINYVDVSDSNATGTAITANNSFETSDNNTNWTINAGVCATGVTISGTIYGTDESTPLGSGLTVKLVNSADTATSYTDDTDGSGNFEITGVAAPTNSDILTLWIDGEGDDGTLVVNYGASCGGSPSCTGLSIYEDRVIIRDENSESITNAMLATCDNDSGTQCSDSEIGFTSETNALTVSDLRELHVWTGDTYAPGGTVTTSPASTQNIADGDIHIDGTGVFTAGGAVSCGGDFTNEGTFTANSNTTTFTGTTTGFQITDGGENFYNVTFNGSGGGWSFQDSTTIDSDLTMTAGTLSGTNDIYVNGGDVTGNGDINLTGGTFRIDTTGNFGGDTNWDFYDLTFGDGSGTTTTTKTGASTITTSHVLTIAVNQTLDAGDDTWILSGTGTPFVINGIFVGSSAAQFRYTGNGATNVTAATYYRLYIGTSNNANVTYTALGPISSIYSVELQSAGTGYINTFDMSTYDLTVGHLSYMWSGAIAVPIRSSFIQSSPGTTTVQSNGWASYPYIGGVGTTTFYNFTVGVDSDATGYGFYLGGDITVLNNFTITDSGGASEHILQTGNGASYNMTVGGNWTNSGTFTVQQGTVTFNATSTGKTITSGSSAFYDVNFDGVGGGWTFAAGNHDVNNNFIITNGVVTASSGTLYVGGNWSNSGTFTHSSGTVEFNATTTGKQITPGSSNFYNVIFNGSGGEWTPQATTTISNDLTVTQGTLLGTQSINVNGGDVTGNGDINLTGGTFTLDGAGNFGGDAAWDFNNITLGDGSGTTTTTLAGTGTITAAGDLVVSTNQTLSGSKTIYVNGGDVTGNGDINLTGGTFRIDTTGNFGGDTNWDFYDLTFGDGSGTTTTTKTGASTITTSHVLTIAVNQTLDAGDDTWILSGTGTPFVVTGIFTPSTSTFSYIGNGTTNVTSTTYAVLSIGTSNSANIAYTAIGAINALQSINLQSAGIGYTNTFDVQGYDLTTGGYWYPGSGGIAVPVRSTLVQTSSGTTTIGSYWWGGDSSPIIGGAGSTTFYNLKIGVTGDLQPIFTNLGGDITVLNNLTITAAGSNNHLLDVTASNYSITVGGNWTNNDTFYCQQGTVTFNATTSGKIITDGGDPFYNIIFNGSGGEWLYQNGASTAPNQTTVQNGTPTFLNTKKGTVSVTGGQLNSDWYVGAHLVDATNTDTNINTDQDSDITISENSGIPQSTVWKYNGGWGIAATSQTTGTDATGINPQPTTTGAIRVREYSMTNSSSCPGVGCTLYKYNMAVAWQPSYGFYDYYDGYGENYLTSCWAGSSTACNDDSSDDDAIGENWYRATPSSVNGTKPYDGLDAPPDQYGTWYVGMIQGLDVTISDDTIEFGIIEPGAAPTNQTNNITVETGAANGYKIYTFSTQQMTFGSNTIADWTGTNEIPTDWSSGEGFGYSTDDITLTGPGDANRFSGPKYAGFTNTGPGLPVADRTGPTLLSAGQNTITYRLGTSAITAAGIYTTTVIFDVVPQY